MLFDDIYMPINCCGYQMAHLVTRVRNILIMFIMSILLMFEQSSIPAY